MTLSDLSAILESLQATKNAATSPAAATLVDLAVSPSPSVPWTPPKQFLSAKERSLHLDLRTMTSKAGAHERGWAKES